jgi:Predicted nucleotide-binding protein containing TIR-like domain
MASLPLVFIGSATEGEDYAHGVKAVLEENGLIVARHWRDVMDEAQSETTIEALVKALNEFDFGVFILSKDDVRTIREQEVHAPRDNVILELGLFTGRIGRERTFIIGPAEFDLRVPTDLLGVNIGTYLTTDENKRSAVRTSADSARTRILSMGRRPPSTAPGARAQATGVADVGPAPPEDGWVTAARDERLQRPSDGSLVPGAWVVAEATGVARVIEVLPSGDGRFTIALRARGIDRLLYVTEDRLFLPRYKD